MARVTKHYYYYHGVRRAKKDARIRGPEARAALTWIKFRREISATRLEKYLRFRVFCDDTVSGRHRDNIDYCRTTARQESRSPLGFQLGLIPLVSPSMLMNEPALSSSLFIIDLSRDARKTMSGTSSIYRQLARGNYPASE